MSGPFLSWADAFRSGVGRVARTGMHIRFFRSGSVTPKLASAWFGATGMPACCEAGAEKDGNSGVRAPRPQYPAGGLARTFHPPCLGDTPRHFVPPLLIEGTQSPRTKIPSMKRGARKGGVCGVSEGYEIFGLVDRPEGGPAPEGIDRCGTRRRKSIFSGWKRPAVLAVALTLAGCATSPDAVGVAQAPEPARLTIINLTARAWQIAVATTAGGESRVVHVEPHAKVAMELARGDYSIEQTLLSPSGQAEATRRLPVSLEAGQSYQWPLATLGDEAAENDFAAERNGANQRTP